MLVRVLFQPPWGAPAEHQMNAERWMFLRASPLPPEKKKNFFLPLILFFSALHPQTSTNKRYQQVRECIVVLKCTVWSAHARRKATNEGARPTLLADVNDQQRCSKRASKKTTLLLFFLTYHSSNKPLFLLVHRPDLRDLSIFRQSESLALEEVTSSRKRLTDERARQTITGQVCPLYPPRAGQRKWRNLWCHKKVPEEKCLRTGCLWSRSHKRLLWLPLPPPDYHPRW